MTTAAAADDVASRVISTAEMKQRDPTVDDTYEEAWFLLDPRDLKICIRVLSEAIQSLPTGDRRVVGQVIGCMALALSRSEKQEIRDGISAGDASAVLRAMKGSKKRRGRGR